MNPAHDDVLERGRERFAAGAPFTPSRPDGSGDLDLLRATGQAEGFDPTSNVVDAGIEKHLVGAYGQRWRQQLEPRRPSWTASEAAAIAAADRIRDAARRAWETARDRWVAVEHVAHLVSQGRGSAAAVVAALRERAELERQFAEASEAYSRAVAAANDLRLAAQARQRDELLQRTT